MTSGSCASCSGGGHDLRRAEIEDPPPLPCRAVADRHDREGAHPAPQHGAARAARRWGAARVAADAQVETRSVPAVRHRRAGQVPGGHGEPGLRHGAGARLHGRARPLPRAGRSPPQAQGGRGFPAPVDRSGRRGPGRLGPLRPHHDRRRAPAARGVRDGAVVVALGVAALRRGHAHGQLPRAPRGGISGLGRRAARDPLRQPEVGGDPAHRRRDRVQRGPVGVREPLRL